jgi:hypothetical protein
MSLLFPSLRGHRQKQSNKAFPAKHPATLARRSPQQSCDVRDAGDPTVVALFLRRLEDPASWRARRVSTCRWRAKSPRTLRACGPSLARMLQQQSRSVACVLQIMSMWLGVMGGG